VEQRHSTQGAWLGRQIAHAGCLELAHGPTISNTENAEMEGMLFRARRSLGLFLDRPLRLVDSYPMTTDDQQVSTMI